MNGKTTNTPIILQSNSAPNTPELFSNNVGIPPFISNNNNPSRTSSVKGIPNYVLNNIPTPSLISKPILIDPVKIEPLKSENKSEVVENKPVVKSIVDTTPIIIHGEVISRDTIPKISTSAFTGNVNIPTIISNTQNKNLAQIARSIHPRYSPNSSPKIPTEINTEFKGRTLEESKSEISSPQIIKGLSPHYIIPGSNRDIVSPNPIPENLVFTPLDIQKTRSYTIENGIPTPHNFSVESKTFPDILDIQTPKPKIPQSTILDLDTPKPKIYHQTPKVLDLDTPKPKITEVSSDIDIEKKSINPEIVETKTSDPITVIEKKFPMPNFSQMSDDEKMYHRVSFEVDFAKLMKLYPHLGITTPNVGEPLEHLHIKKLRYIKQIYNDQTTQGFREYMILFWACLELFVVKALGLNASGYTMSQVMRMNQYDTMLVELGEKYTGDMTSGLPVEARLAFWTAVHTFTFVFFNYLAKWIGPGLSSMVRSFIDNLSTGRVIHPIADANGNISIPGAVPRDGVQNVMGVPVASVVQGMSSMMLPNPNTNTQTPVAQPKKSGRPKFKEI
jgi:hypothetical protein